MLDVKDQIHDAHIVHITVSQRHLDKFRDQISGVIYTDQIAPNGRLLIYSACCIPSKRKIKPFRLWTYKNVIST